MKSVWSFYQASLISGGTHMTHNKGITSLDVPRDHVTSWWLWVTDAEEMPEWLSWRVLSVPVDWWAQNESPIV
jgi:hypothetical protein